MASEHFYYRTIWETITAFANSFTDIGLYVYDKDKTSPTYGLPIGRKVIPIILAPKEKVISVLDALLGSEKAEVDNVLPKISIQWGGGLSYDSSRNRGKNQKRTLFVEYTTTGAFAIEEGLPTPANPNTPARYKHFDIQTVPWKMDIEMIIWAKYEDDGVQIIEQILPFYSPDRQISLIERAIGIQREAKVTLNSVNGNFATNLNDPDRRILQWNLSFTVELNLYKPIYYDSEIFQSIIRVGTVQPNKAYGDSITTTAFLADIQGVDPQVMTRIQAFDQLTASTAEISGNLSYITINTWNNPVATFTPLASGADGFPPYNPEAGELSIQLPGFNDAHNPPGQFLYPVSRVLAADYYNELNPQNPVPSDPTAQTEFQEWQDDGSPGGG